MASTVARGPIIPESGDPESDGSSGEDRETLKRPHGEVDSSGAKKRRKQSTPVRFPTSLIADEAEEESDEDAAEDSEGKPAVGQDRIHQTSKDENLNNEFRCQYCSQLFDSKQALNQHLNNEHNLSNVSRQNSERSPVPSHVHIKQEPQTHQDQPESPVNLSGIGIKSFAATWLQSGHVQSQSSHQVQLQSQSEEWPPSGSAASLSSISNHLQTLPFPGPLAQYLPLPNFSIGDSSQVNARPPIGPAPVRIFNPDAYCDLCNKEFCNKYFLKTHKANKHGIYVDTPGQTVGESGFTGAPYSGSFLATGMKLEQQPQQQLKLEPAAPPGQPAIQIPAGSLNSICDICQKRFKNEDSVRKHKQKVHCADPGDGIGDAQMLPPHPNANEEEKETSHHSLSPGAMEALFKQEFGVEQEDTTFMPAPRHLSPQSVQQARDSGFSADRLRRLGVINPEAFCEICCKEYCNKYFLRTHKMKRHGIVVQENEKSPSNPAAAAAWHHVQTSPLNLIVGETSGNSSESGDRPGEDYECKPCGIRFQTIGLHQAHRQKIHENEEPGSPKQENDPDGGDQRADSISEDLQKLQTMILQLNGLESGRGPPCPICGKDYETRQALRNHMAVEHGAVVEDAASSSSPPQPNAEKSPTPSSGSLSCTFCEKEFPGQEALRKHLAEDHQPSTPTSTSASAPLPNVLPTPPATLTPTTTTPTTAQPSQERRASVSMTPTSSYCEICNKELCNKYFMKTHMQRMHGIEIENGAQIGGVICNICNKELCSKYFLRVHKHNTHGIIEEGTTTTTTTSSSKQPESEASNSEDPALKPEQLGDLSHRYFTHFTEVCPICSRRFRSTKWLKAHLLSDHGKIGIDKWRELEQQYQSGPRSGRTPGPSRVPHQNPSLKIPNGIELAQHMKTGDYAGLGNQVLSTLFGSTEDQQLKSYRCSYCTFTTPVLAFLFVHERSHTSPQSGASIEGERTLQCPVCLQGFPQPELLQHHLLTQHQFPGLIPPFQPHLITSSKPESSSEKDSESKDRTDLDSKDDSKQASPHASLSISSNDLPSKLQRPEDATAVQVTPQGAYKCAQCGYATANLNRIKKHIRKDHRSVTNANEHGDSGVIGELSRTLREIASRQKLPASYAMPQELNSNPEKTVMQPFIIEECDVAVHGNPETISEKRFGPALVYLPVRTRVNAPLTTSFNLSPA